MSFTTHFPKVAYELPRCSVCYKVMMLARTDPSSPGVNHRTFECECGHFETLLVKYK